MKPEEAIEELKNYNSSTFETSYVPFSKALQLGIEALKRLQECKEHHCTVCFTLLPGETLE